MSINRIIIDQDDYPDPGTFYAFDDFEGALQPKLQQPQILERGGHRGESLLMTGVRAVDSVLRSKRGFADGDDAIDALEPYGDLIDGMGYQVIQHGRSWGFYKVITIRNLGLVPWIAAGTLVENSTVCQILEWTLRSTDPPEEP